MSDLARDSLAANASSSKRDGSSVELLEALALGGKVTSAAFDEEELELEVVFGLLTVLFVFFIIGLLLQFFSSSKAADALFRFCTAELLSSSSL